MYKHSVQNSFALLWCWTIECDDELRVTLGEIFFLQVLNIASNKKIVTYCHLHCICAQVVVQPLDDTMPKWIKNVALGQGNQPSSNINRTSGSLYAFGSLLEQSRALRCHWGNYRCNCCGHRRQDTWRRCYWLHDSSAGPRIKQRFSFLFKHVEFPNKLRATRDAVSHSHLLPPNW